MFVFRFPCDNVSIDLVTFHWSSIALVKFIWFVCSSCYSLFNLRSRCCTSARVLNTIFYIKHFQERENLFDLLLAFTPYNRPIYMLSIFDVQKSKKFDSLIELWIDRLYIDYSHCIVLIDKSYTETKWKLFQPLYVSHAFWNEIEEKWYNRWLSVCWIRCVNIPNEISSSLFFVVFLFPLIDFKYRPSFSLGSFSLHFLVAVTMATKWCFWNVLFGQLMTCFVVKWMHAVSITLRALKTYISIFRTWWVFHLSKVLIMWFTSSHSTLILLQ